MSEGESGSQGYTANREMGIIGYIIGAFILVLLLPLLPLILVGWLSYRLVTTIRDEDAREAGRLSWRARQST